MPLRWPSRRKPKTKSALIAFRAKRPLGPAPRRIAWRRSPLSSPHCPLPLSASPPLVLTGSRSLAYWTTLKKFTHRTHRHYWKRIFTPETGSSPTARAVQGDSTPGPDLYNPEHAAEIEAGELPAKEIARRSSSSSIWHRAALLSWIKRDMS